MNGYFRGDELGIGTSLPAAKMAALFFDRIVFPLPRWTFEDSNVPPREIVYESDVKDVGQTNFLPFALMQRARPGQSISTWEWPAHHLHKALAKKGISCVPVYTDPDALKRVTPDGSDTALEFKVLRAPVIDISRIDWDNIMELRSDEDSRQRLRRFRLMLHQEFEGKSEAYIQDSLLTRVEDFRKACKKHGLGLITAVTSELLSSNSILASAGMALAGMLTGDARLAAIGAAPLTVEIGRVAIKIVKHELDVDQPSDNPIAWLAHLADISRSTEAT